jgi:hypothetical protein
VSRGPRALTLLVLAVALALAVPAGAQAAGTSYAGQTSPQDFSNDHVDNGTPKPFGFDVVGSTITNIAATTSLRCPDGSFLNVSTVPDEYGEPFAFSNGHFDGTIGNASKGSGLTWHVVGTIAGGRATGTADVRMPQYTSTHPNGPICTSQFTWSASLASPPQTQIAPTTPRPGRPDVSLQVVGLRTMNAVPARFYWGAEQIHCLNGATDVIVKVGRSRKDLKCRPGISVASSQVAPHRTYLIRLQAVKMRGRRVVARGASYSASMYMPGLEANWVPVPGLHFRKG